MNGWWTTGNIKSSPFKTQDLGERGVNRDACIELRLRKVALTPDHTLLSKLVSITCLQHAFLLSGTQPWLQHLPHKYLLLCSLLHSKVEQKPQDEMAKRWALCPSSRSGEGGLPPPLSLLCHLSVTFVLGPAAWSEEVSFSGSWVAIRKQQTHYHFSAQWLANSVIEIMILRLSCPV